MQRIFLVGCPRSGTTIFQSLLAAHPLIASFPETKIFHYTLWGEFTDKLPERLTHFFNNEIQRPELLETFDKNNSLDTIIKWFLNILDELALEENKSTWIEKTPEHIFFIQDISLYIPDAKFIHITRNGLDTIASMYEATRMSQNELWGGEWSLDYCIRRWRSCNSITQSHANNPQHLVVKYEDLLADKIAILKTCCKFIGIEYDDAVLTNYKSEALKLGLNMSWHDGIDREIEAPAIPKHKRIFQQHEIDYIKRQVNVYTKNSLI